jgi:hypothetical protein
MKPFNLADVNQFEIETNSGTISLLMPREGGQTARLQIAEAALPRLIMTLIAASVEMRKHVGDLLQPAEVPPEHRVLMPSVELDVGGSLNQDGALTIRAGRLDFRIELEAKDYEALAHKLKG